MVPPGIGIVHQVNLEYLAKGVLQTGDLFYPDTLVGTDSHTTMINGLGIVGWGVGGIEAEAGMLGQPVYFLTPDVVGVHMTGALHEGVTATDLALHITQMLRAKVVGKFVEFYGAGAASLPLPDRATIGNMAPEYGATMGYFPVDAETVKYLRAPAAPRSSAAPSRIISAPKKCSACRARARSITASTSNWTLATSSRAWPAPNGRRIGSNWASSEAHFTLCWSSHRRKVATERRRLISSSVIWFISTARRPRQRKWFRPSSRIRAIEPGDELNKVEMSRIGRRRIRAAKRGGDSVYPSWPEPHRPRQRAHRRDHQLHQHEQSQRDAGGRFACQESGASAA